MLSHFKKVLFSGQTQLNLIGIALFALLSSVAWRLSHPLTLESIILLVCVGYAAFRIVYELTWNRKGVPTIATGFIGRRKIAQILKLEAAGPITALYSIVDLGSGRGELTRHIAKAIPRASVTGVELARIPFMQARFIQKWLGPPNLSYECLDFWPYDCSNIDAVVFYLSYAFCQGVGEKLHKEMKSGGLVISHSFPLEKYWGQPEKIVHYRTPFKEVFYVYRKTSRPLEQIGGH